MRQTISSFSPSAVCELAKLAGEQILAIYREVEPSAALLSRKSDDSPLTRADLAAHDCIHAGLTSLTPSIPVVSEEDQVAAAPKVASERFWLVDPLDGTKEFLARNGEFTVNIALVEAGVPVWGVVYAPALGQMYWGGRLHGTYRSIGECTEEIHVSAAVAPGGQHRVVASKSHLNEQTSAFIERLGSVQLIQAGSSLKFCRVAEGAADVYPRLAPTCEWDTAAAQAVLEGAGGQVLDLQGQRLRYGKPDVLNPHFIAAASPLALLERQFG